MGGPMTQIFRGFWHGRPLSSYELVCLRSVVAHGHRFELFTYDREILVPDWISRRDAQEIFPTDHVMAYHTGLGAGSPALHSDIFQLARELQDAQRARSEHLEPAIVQRFNQKDA